MLVEQAVSKGRKEIHTGGWKCSLTGAENSLASISRKGGGGRGAINSMDLAVQVDQDAPGHWKENLSGGNVPTFEPPHECPWLILVAGDCAEANLS